MNIYIEIQHLNLYLRKKYDGYTGVPKEWLELETLGCKPTIPLKPIRGFYDFLDVAEAIAIHG
jgi:hypothetical protein